MPEEPKVPSQSSHSTSAALDSTVPGCWANGSSPESHERHRSENVSITKRVHLTRISYITDDVALLLSNCSALTRSSPDHIDVNGSVTTFAYNSSDQTIANYWHGGHYPHEPICSFVRAHTFM
jgi:hypothetical protein